MAATPTLRGEGAAASVSAPALVMTELSDDSLDPYKVHPGYLRDPTKSVSWCEVCTEVAEKINQGVQPSCSKDFTLNTFTPDVVRARAGLQAERAPPATRRHLSHSVENRLASCNPVAALLTPALIPPTLPNPAHTCSPLLPTCQSTFLPSCSLPLSSSPIPLTLTTE